MAEKVEARAKGITACAAGMASSLANAKDDIAEDALVALAGHECRADSPDIPIAMAMGTAAIRIFDGSRLIRLGWALRRIRILCGK